MGGYCSECGETICICDEIEKNRVKHLKGQPCACCNHQPVKCYYNKADDRHHLNITIGVWQMLCSGDTLQNLLFDLAVQSQDKVIGVLTKQIHRDE